MVNQLAVTCRSVRLFTVTLLSLAVSASVQQAFGADVNFLLPNLLVTQELPSSDLALNGVSYVNNGGIVNTAAVPISSDFLFEETDMVGFSTFFNNNRHEFTFSEDGANPIAVNGDEPWELDFDVSLNGTLLSPRKAFNFVVFDGGSQSNSLDSFINLTTNRTPSVNGLSDAPGESAMFGGEYDFVRLIGPADGDPLINLNPSVGYVGGDTVNFKIIHTPSPDGGTTPSTVEHIYDDGTGPYTTGARPLRRSGVFADDATLGFIIQGIAHSGTGPDSHTVQISNFNATIGEQTDLPGDFDGNQDYECADIDQLIAEIAAGTNNLDFDLTADNLVTLADRDEWLSIAGAAELPGMVAYAVGDADLDGDVDGDDFGIWSANKFQTTGAWCSADFDADGDTDGHDFLAWNENKGFSAGVTAIPESSSLHLVSMLCLAAWCTLRTRK